jgi:hypothetical protein
MGGVVVVPNDTQSSQGSSGKSLNGPELFGFRDFQANLLTCAKSWDDIANASFDGRYLAISFQEYVFEGLRNLPDSNESKAVDDMLTQSVKTRRKNPVLFVMRYCIKLHRVKELEVSGYMINLWAASAYHS